MDKLQDKIINCSDCGRDFPFTIKEQEFFKSKGYGHDPKRCRNCRRQRRNEQNSREDREENRQFRGMPDGPRSERR